MDNLVEKIGGEKINPLETIPHVDSFIWDNFENDAYAQWMLMHFRLPAIQKSRWRQFIGERKLFCRYENKKHRVIGASRLGDVWLTSKFKNPQGYEKRVPVEKCTEWSAR